MGTHATEAGLEGTPAGNAGALSAEQFREKALRIEHEVGKVIVGQRHVVHQVLVCLLAGGNALLEGVPGLGKTVLVRTLADLRLRSSETSSNSFARANKSATSSPAEAT